MSSRDRNAIIIIGAAIGLLVQPIVANNAPGIHLGLAARVGIVILFALCALVALYLAQLISRWWGVGIYQFAKFAAVGTLNSFIDVGVFNLETFWYGTSFIGIGFFALFKGISFLFGTTNSFLWNKYWTFSVTGKTSAKQIGGFYGIAVLGWLLNVGVATGVKALGPAGTGGDARVWVNIVAPLAGIAASFIWNFFGYKYFVFKKQVATA
jgi:putative flippase GtrA